METRTRPAVLPASLLMHDKVRNTAGEDLGKIEDFAVDLDLGCVAYAVLSFGGFMGMGDKLFAIPWQAMRVDVEQRAFILDIDKETLKNAPGFDKDNWPGTQDREWIGLVYEYYGYEPYWRTRTPSR